MGHFHKYLYDHNITVFTDHAALKAVLQTPNPSSKHARWWTKVYGSGVKDVQILGECIALWGEPNELSIRYRIYIFIQYVDS